IAHEPRQRPVAAAIAIARATLHRQGLRAAALVEHVHLRADQLVEGVPADDDSRHSGISPGEEVLVGPRAPRRERSEPAEPRVAGRRKRLWDSALAAPHRTADITHLAAALELLR